MANNKVDCEWIKLTYEPDQDYKGMRITELMPLRAFEYLVRTNPAIGLRDNKNKRCDTPFNKLTKIFKSAPHCTYPTSTWFTRQGMEGHWRSRLQDLGVALDVILGTAAAPLVPVPKKATKRALEMDVVDGGWLELTYELDGDFEGYGIVGAEHMPVRAFEYLQHTNPCLDMHGSLGKTCFTPFNELKNRHTELTPQIIRPVSEWFESPHDGEWRGILKAQGVTMDDILHADFNPNTKKKKARIEKLRPHAFVVALDDACNTYFFDSQDEKKRERVSSVICGIVNKHGEKQADYLLSWLGGQIDESAIPEDLEARNAIIKAHDKLVGDGGDNDGWDCRGRLLFEDCATLTVISDI